jgi:hypothetical protein
MGAAGDLWNQFEILTCKKGFAGLGSLFVVDASMLTPSGVRRDVTRLLLFTRRASSLL